MVSSGKKNYKFFTDYEDDDDDNKYNACKNERLIKKL